VTDPSTPRTPYHFDVIEAGAAFQELRPELDAIPPAEFTAMNSDPATGASIALGSVSRLMALREEIVVQLPLFEIRLLDQLHKYAYAAWYADIMSLPASSGQSEEQALLAEGGVLRETLLIGAGPLAHRRLLDPATIEAIRSGSGPKDTAADLVALGTVYTNNWGAIDGKTIVTRAEVDRARVVGSLLFAAISVRETPPSALPITPEMRVRAFTALDRTYGKLRRAAQYLRGDEADTIAPTIRPQAPRHRADGSTATSPAPAAPAESLAVRSAAPPSAGAPIGGGSGPFQR